MAFANRSPDPSDRPAVGDLLQAVRALTAHNRFDVALLDLHMPGINGLELLGRLQELQPELEAIMLTAHGSIETAIQAMKQGAYDFLTKPAQFPELEVHIQKAFEKVKLARRERQWVAEIAFESARCRLVGSSPVADNYCRFVSRLSVTGCFCMQTASMDLQGEHAAWQRCLGTARSSIPPASGGLFCRRCDGGLQRRQPVARLALLAQLQTQFNDGAGRPQPHRRRRGRLRRLEPLLPPMTTAMKFERRARSRRIALMAV